MYKGGENYVKVESYVQRASRTAVYGNIDSRISYIQTRWAWRRGREEKHAERGGEEIVRVVNGERAGEQARSTILGYIYNIDR